ncbi:UNVERIFIED_CONTAM: hypothetical protein RMT77_015754 [Armadillidium vulgare]
MAPKKQRFLKLSKYPFMKTFLTKEWEVVEEEKGNADTIYNASIEVVWPSFQTYLERNGYSDNFCSKVLFGKLMNLCGIEKMRRGPRGKQKYFYYPIKPVKGSKTESLFIRSLHSTLSQRYLKLSDNVKKLIHEEVLQKKLNSISYGKNNSHDTSFEFPKLPEVDGVKVKVLPPLEQTSNHIQSSSTPMNDTFEIDPITSYSYPQNFPVTTTNTLTDTFPTNSISDPFSVIDSHTTPTCSFLESESDLFSNLGLLGIRPRDANDSFYISNNLCNTFPNIEEDMNSMNYEPNPGTFIPEQSSNNNAEVLNNSFASFLTMQNFYNITKFLLDYQGGLNNMYKYGCHTPEPNVVTESQLELSDNCDCDFCKWPN